MASHLIFRNNLRTGSSLWPGTFRCNTVHVQAKMVAIQLVMSRIVPRRLGPASQPTTASVVLFCAAAKASVAERSHMLDAKR